MFSDVLYPSAANFTEEGSSKVSNTHQSVCLLLTGVFGFLKNNPKAFVNALAKKYLTD